MAQDEFCVRGLGETVIRARDLPRMVEFYRDGLGLELWRRIGEEIVFFRLADGFRGHTTILALFAERRPSNREGHVWQGHQPSVTTLHHFALTIPLDEYEAAQRVLTQRGVPFNTFTHAWIGWRSIYVQDPEQNVVELVCHDPTALDPNAASAIGVRGADD